MIKVYFQKMHPQAQLPTRGSTEAAGWDLKALEEIIIPADSTRTVRTGLRMKMESEVPDGTYGKDRSVMVASVRSRSGLAAKNGVFVLNSPGTIDQDYRGELKVILHNTSDTPYHVYAGDRVAQVTFGFAIVPDVIEVAELPTDDTERGEGGFGSTGIRGADNQTTMFDEAAFPGLQGFPPQPPNTSVKWVG